MDLNGPWLARAATEDLRRAYPEPDFDSSAWSALAVPGRWSSDPHFADCNGPVLYRRRFRSPAPRAGRRLWLTFDGISEQGDVWLDGSYVGDTEGYFIAHTFEVTEALRARSDHLLAAEVTANLEMPGGIWKGVRLTETGPVRISQLRVRCIDATPERAVLQIRAVLDSAAAGRAQLRTTVTPASGGSPVGEALAENTLAAGENRINFTVRIDDPNLWWPRALGAQPLHDVVVAVELPDSGVSDESIRRTGLRQVRMKNWIMTINGERLFLKGVTLDAPRPTDITMAKETGLDLVRVHSHSQDVHEAADRLGVLLWQDLPLRWDHTRGARKQAIRQSREALTIAGHHPSIALWCASKTVLDENIRLSLARSDPTRPIVADAAPFPRERHFDRWYARWPRSARFVTEFEPGFARFHIETLRRLKYRPAGGFCAPESVAESALQPGAAVIVVATRPEPTYRAGEEIRFDVHVGNDLRAGIEGAIATACLRWQTGERTWRWEGDVPPDSCVKAGSLSMEAPRARGPLTLSLTLDAPGVSAVNRYESIIAG